MYNLVLMEQFAKDILYLNSMQRAWHMGVLFLYVLLADDCRIKKDKWFISQNTGNNFMHSHYCHSPFTLVPQWKCANVVWTSWHRLQVSSTGSCSTFIFYSLIASLCFFSLSVLHTCKACECGSLRDDSSVAHLIVAWPYLGCPEIHSSVLVCRREEQAMQGC